MNNHLLNIDHNTEQSKMSSKEEMVEMWNKKEITQIIEPYIFSEKNDIKL